MCKSCLADAEQIQHKCRTYWTDGLMACAVQGAMLGFLSAVAIWKCQGKVGQNTSQEMGQNFHLADDARLLVWTRAARHQVTNKTYQNTPRQSRVFQQKGHRWSGLCVCGETCREKAMKSPLLYACRHGMKAKKDHT